MSLGLAMAAVIGGPFPLLCTPYAENGEVDFATQAKEARLVARIGTRGVISQRLKFAGIE